MERSEASLQTGMLLLGIFEHERRTCFDFPLVGFAFQAVIFNQRHGIFRGLAPIAIFPAFDNLRT